MFWRGRFCSFWSQRFRVLISHITFWKFGSIGLTLQSFFPLHMDCLSTQPRRQRDVEGEREYCLGFLLRISFSTITRVVRYVFNKNHGYDVLARFGYSSLLRQPPEQAKWVKFFFF